MLRSLYTAATGLAAQQFSLDVLSNNLANASTTGFKSSRANFQDLLYQTTAQPGAQTGANSQLPTGAQVGLGVTSGTTTRSSAQGTIQNTGGTYDLAINGSGYFQVLLPTGATGYSRDGSFNVDSTGKLVTSQGYPVQPEIVIPANNTGVTLSGDGQVSVTLAGQTASQVVGQLQLATFPNPAGLLAIGGNLYQPTNASGQPVTGAPGVQGMGALMPNSLESSNVNTVDEIVQMIIIQRAYDTNSKVIQASDDMLNTTNGIKR